MHIYLALIGHEMYSYVWVVWFCYSRYENGKEIAAYHAHEMAIACSHQEHDISDFKHKFIVALPQIYTLPNHNYLPCLI